ncbi:hypothetical protein PIB30_046135 [Stylosanthes scabra]|uniref:Uncharacterized protein n=1 Tax=Stylosanthes scabra TaxID=79078 RepID=A0ABU6RGD9_9FABA|nr:hypothetical protein [Stylosanthes scabra]
MLHISKFEEVDIKQNEVIFILVPGIKSIFFYRLVLQVLDPNGEIVSDQPVTTKSKHHLKSTLAIRFLHLTLLLLNILRQGHQDTKKQNDILHTNSITKSTLQFD